jgi:hypothetical protein
VLICATAAHRDLAILHDDNDVVVASARLSDLRQRPVRALPEAFESPEDLDFPAPVPPAAHPHR